MRRVELANAAMAVLGLAAAIGLSQGTLGVTSTSGEPRGSEEVRSVVDETGERFRVGDRSRIASASTVADRLLLDLYDADRVVAVTAYSAEADVDRHRFAGRATIAQLDDLEAIVALRPDLVVVNNHADVERVERLREAGLTVFDLGPVIGLDSVLEDARRLSSLLGVPDRGVRYADALARRMESVARHVPPSDRARGLYLGVVGDQIYGGTVGSSYHDVLRFAGVVDVAAEAGLTGWPQYRAEMLLELDPPLVVTKPAMGGPLCRHPGLDALSVCRGAGRIVEVDGSLVDAVGPSMLEAAEAVHRAVYPE